MRYNFDRRISVGAASLASMLLAGTSVVAQQAPRHDPSISLEEIVVTAQRREEKLQDVPIAVTALTAKALAASGIDQTRQLQLVTPGLVTYQIGGGLGALYLLAGTLVWCGLPAGRLLSRVCGLLYLPRQPFGSLVWETMNSAEFQAHFTRR